MKRRGVIVLAGIAHMLVCLYFWPSIWTSVAVVTGFVLGAAIRAGQDTYGKRWGIDLGRLWLSGPSPVHSECPTTGQKYADTYWWFVWHRREIDTFPWEAQ